MKKIIIVLLGIAQLTRAQIYEIHSMNELKPFVTPSDDILIVFDIDSTLLKLDNKNTTVPWFCNELALLQKTEQKPRNEVYKKLLFKHAPRLYQEYSKQLISAPTELSESFIPEIISNIVKSNIHFLIQTKRGLPHIDITHQQFDKLNLTDKATKKWRNISYKLTEGLEQPAYYDDGILFAGWENTKGDALKAFFKKLNYKPKRLVAVDDEKDNLESFAAMAREMGIEFVGLRYGFLDEVTKKSGPRVFDPLNCGAAA